MRRISLLFAISIVAACALPAAAGAAVDRFVDRDTGVNAGDCSAQGSPCQNVGYAVSQSGTGDTVKVDDSSGSYFENIALQNNVSLRGFEFVDADEGSVVIDGTGSSAVLVNSGQSAGTIDGLTLRTTGVGVNGFGSVAAVTDDRFDGGGATVGIRVGAGSPTISNNVFTDSGVGGINDSGVQLDNTTGATISDNSFTNLSHPIVLGSAAATSNTQITGNQITGVHTSTFAGFGILAQQSSGLVIDDNVISGFADTGTTGISVTGNGSASSATMRRNQVYGAGSGIFLADNLSAVVLRNDIVAGSAGFGLTLFDDSSGGNGDAVAKNLTLVNGGGGSDVSISGTDADLVLDSSIVAGNGITAGGTSTCLITNSRGPTTTPGGNGCSHFQTTQTPSFVNAGSNNFRLTGSNPVLIDNGDLAAPVLQIWFEDSSLSRTQW